MRPLAPLALIAALALSACAPPEYRAALGDTDGPAPATPALLPLADLLPAAEAPSAEAEAAEKTRGLDDRSRALQARAAAREPAPRPDTAAREAALRARADALRQRP